MRCGGNHLASMCKFKEYKCRSCGKVGHLAKVCSSKQPAEPQKSMPTQKNASKMNYVSGGKLSQSEDENVKREDDSSYSLFTLLSSSATNPYSVDLDINNRSVAMELDTGVSLSIISEDVFKSLSLRPPLELTSVKSTTYSGESLEILGKVHVIVNYEGNNCTLSVIVVMGSGPYLLGRDWLQELQLNWKKIFQICSNDKLKELLHKYCHVFSEELGTYKGIEITIHVKPNTKPRFFKHWSVPYILKSKIETELQQLQSLGIITLVKSSDWAAPIVPVTKLDGSVRICGDYKLNINQAAHIESYPLPKIEDLLSALAGGVAFTKLDLAQAYLQLPLSDCSKQYVTMNTHKGLFEFNRVPFGITLALAVFQRCIDTLFQGSNGVIVCIDDILVTGETIEEQLQNLEVVLLKLSEVGLKLKQQKCIFQPQKLST
uniref:CCHC-type domain-containing protein n=1 Tax=Amphimedon queenslandica TaxID=400682 RepID=A0A1X7TFY9_AMPQE